MTLLTPCINNPKINATWGLFDNGLAQANCGMRSERIGVYTTANMRAPHSTIRKSDSQVASANRLLERPRPRRGSSIPIPTPTPTFDLLSAVQLSFTQV
jgi:hypothetical protein